MLANHCAVLLAAGHGRRAGGPKALKVVGGELWWRVQARSIGCDVGRVVAVLHPDARLADEAGILAIHGDPDAAPLASLQLGLRQVAANRAVFVLPVDCPWPGREVALALAAALQAPALAARPLASVDGRLRGGHPLLLAPEAAAEIGALDPATARLDYWLRDLPAGLRRDVVVGDSRVLANFNADGVGR